MAFFLSTYTNKIDKKGRISVPASFRSSVHAPASGNHFPGVVLYKPFGVQCIEGADMAYLERITEHFNNDFGPFSTEHDAMAEEILGGSTPLQFDPEGRIMLPPALCEFAGIEANATFVGMGKKFRIWNPEVFEAQGEQRRIVAGAAAIGLKPLPTSGGRE